MQHRLKLRLSVCLFLLLFVFSLPVSATHQRAAEIIYKHLSGLTYEFTLISYTYTPSPANAYRDYLLINWGDGTSSEIPRVEETYLPNDITYNRYVGTHIFPGPSSYTISCEDPNRNGGIQNIPNSINTPLFIYSELVINPFLGGITIPRYCFYLQLIMVVLINLITIIPGHTILMVTVFLTGLSPAVVLSVRLYPAIPILLLPKFSSWIQ